MSETACGQHGTKFMLMCPSCSHDKDATIAAKSEEIERIRTSRDEWEREFHSHSNVLKELETTIASLHGDVATLKNRIGVAPMPPIEWRGLPREIVDFFDSYRRWVGSSIERIPPDTVAVSLEKWEAMTRLYSAMRHSSRVYNPEISKRLDVVIALEEPEPTK